MGSVARAFKAYDIRGEFPQDVDPDLAYAVGHAFRRFTGADRVVVGHDMRTSSPPLVQALVNGVLDGGADVVNIGLASTDLTYFASGYLQAPAAMITASHNPARFNGIKLCLPGARPVGQDTGLLEVRELVEEGTATLASARGHASELSLARQFVKHVTSFADVAAMRPLHVIADTANGMAGLTLPWIFADLPVRLEIMYGELDGSFPHHPADPLNPDNLVDLRAAVLERKADLGLAFDGDADRVVIVDETGVVLTGSVTTCILAKEMLRRDPGATVLYSALCSWAVPESIAEGGGHPVRTRVGHSFIKARMAATDAVFGGEHSAHFYFRDNYRADSGVIATMVMLDVLSRTGERLSDLRARYERYVPSGEINLADDEPARIVTELATRFTADDASETGRSLDEGLTIEYPSWWFNVRASNTEPLLRVNVEASDAAECQRRTDEILRKTRELMHAGS